MSDPVHIFQTLQQSDPEAQRKALSNIVDMVIAKIEAGQVDSIAIMMVAKDPAVNGGEAYTGSRFLVKPQHLDLLDDTYRQMMAALEKNYGVTVEGLRRDRAGHGGLRG